MSAEPPGILCVFVYAHSAPPPALLAAARVRGCCLPFASRDDKHMLFTSGTTANPHCVFSVASARLFDSGWTAEIVRRGGGGEAASRPVRGCAH